MIRIALLGFGNVGRALARYLESAGKCRAFPICGIADVTGGLILSDPREARLILEMQEKGESIADCAQLGSFHDVPSYVENLPKAGVKVLVECMPTNPADGQPALGLIRKAIDHGLAVVTVDKGPMVHAFHSLLAAAAARGVRIAYSGTTGVRPPAEIAGCRVLGIDGILNGTTNYILTEMQVHGLSFDRALAEAREKGIAEPNPELDIQGWDTACKLLILANEYMDAAASLTDVARTGIGPETEALIAAARTSGSLVRLIGSAHLTQGRASLSVAPRIVGPQSPLHSISGTSKGATFFTAEKGEIFAGGVSGRDAIAQIIVDDIVRIQETGDRRQ